jgi:DNA-binding MarR family transcriptional regulator
MSTAATLVSGFDQAPYVGALLRLVHGEARSRILKALVDRGMGDIGQTYFGLFQFPGVEGQRPSEVAKRLGISKQALNHMVGQLERLGYLERHSAPGGRHTSLRYTDRGWQVLDTSVQTMLALEAEWQDQLGATRFSELKATLRFLAGME